MQADGHKKTGALADAGFVSSLLTRAAYDQNVYFADIITDQRWLGFGTPGD